MRHGGAGARQMTTISLNDSCSRAYQLCASESGNTNAARPSSVSTSSTQNSQTMSPTMVFCARARAPAPLSAGTLREAEGMLLATDVRNARVSMLPACAGGLPGPLLLGS